MDVISIAMALSQFAPSVVKWISGSDKAADAAYTIVGIAEAVTGKSGADAVAAMQADPAAVLEFRAKLVAIEADLDRAYLADRADARARDIEIIKAGRNNTRADLMVAGAVAGLLGCLAALTVFKGDLPGEAVGIISTVAGIFGACLKDAFQYEFGSSRGSAEKSELMAKLKG